ncbi:MAG: hypothetical protein U5L00_15860 [Desulfovermiculus sp.]|nr:hypothetical protein [Desulfovermiculus sp.]
MVNQRKHGESEPAWHNRATLTQAGVSLGKLLLHLTIFSSSACDLPRLKRSWTLSGPVSRASPRPVERERADIS